MARTKLVNMMKIYHEYFHLFFGLIALIIYTNFWSLNLFFGLLITIFATHFPDADHIISAFSYGRKTIYGKNIRHLLLSGQVRNFAEYVRRNHKDNYFILSHNLLTPLICLVISLIFNPGYLSLFFFVAVFHYLFDILEDLFVFGKLNQNWYLKFKAKN